MQYCRRCGTHMEDDARFCHKCGTPVIPIAASQPAQTFYVHPKPAQPNRPWHKDSLVVVSVALVAVLVVAVIAVAVLSTPFASWDTNQSLEDKTVGVKTLNLSFHTNVGEVIVFTQKIGDNNVGIYIQANGSRGLFSDNTGPVSIEFANNTFGDILNVESTVKVADPFTTGARVQCLLYINPELELNLNISSTTGEVSFSGVNSPTIQSLSLETTTGAVQANLESDTTVAGNLSIRAVTGEVNYRMSQTKIIENCSLTLHSTTGAVNMDITQTKTLDGNLDVVADTSTGSINVGLTIDSGVSAQVTSKVSGLGEVSVEKNNFVGEDEDIHSLNYPAQSNINIDSHVHGIGGVNVHATYLTTLLYS